MKSQCKDKRVKMLAPTLGVGLDGGRILPVVGGNDFPSIALANEDVGSHAMPQVGTACVDRDDPHYRLHNAWHKHLVGHPDHEATNEFFGLGILLVWDGGWCHIALSIV